MVSRRPVALIAGINGQDGSYMAELLVGEGYRVFGITRDPSVSPSLNVRHLGEAVTLLYSSYELRQLIDIIERTKPSEIYNFAGQSYVGKSWDMVEETIHSQGVLVSRLLEAILATNPKIRLLNASSAEIYNPTGPQRLNEASPIQPYNPYGCAKALGHCMVDAYRDARGLFAVNAILFPHESPRRDANFAFKKIMAAAAAIGSGSRKKLKLGNLEVSRDWGYAPAFVAAMRAMLRAKVPQNLCLCTGKTHTVKDIVRMAFTNFGLDWREHVEVDAKLCRAAEPLVIAGNPERASKQIGWVATPRIEELIAAVIDFEMRMATGQEKDFRNEHPRYN